MTALVEERDPSALWQATLTPPRVDLLPPEIAQRSRLHRLQLGVGGVLLTVVAVVAALSTAASATLQDAEQELDAVSTRGAALQEDSARYVDVLDVHRRADAASDMLRLALGEEVRFSGLLGDLSRTVPDSVWLEDVTFAQSSADPAAPATAAAPATTATAAGATAAGATAAGATAAGIGTVTFTGRALSHDDVAAWLDALAEQRGFADPALTSSTATAAVPGAPSTVEFASTVTLTSVALSGRYVATTAGR